MGTWALVPHSLNPAVISQQQNPAAVALARAHWHMGTGNTGTPARAVASEVACALGHLGTWELRSMRGQLHLHGY